MPRSGPSGGPPGRRRAAPRRPAPPAARPGPRPRPLPGPRSPRHRRWPAVAAGRRVQLGDVLFDHRGGRFGEGDDGGLGAVLDLGLSGRQVRLVRGLLMGSRPCRRPPRCWRSRRQLLLLLGRRAGRCRGLRPWPSGRRRPGYACRRTSAPGPAFCCVDACSRAALPGAISARLLWWAATIQSVSCSLGCAAAGAASGTTSARTAPHPSTMARRTSVIVPSEDVQVKGRHDLPADGERNRHSARCPGRSARLRPIGERPDDDDGMKRCIGCELCVGAMSSTSRSDARHLAGRLPALARVAAGRGARLGRWKTARTQRVVSWSDVIKSEARRSCRTGVRRDPRTRRAARPDRRSGLAADGRRVREHARSGRRAVPELERRGRGAAAEARHGLAM